MENKSIQLLKLTENKSIAKDHYKSGSNQYNKAFITHTFNETTFNYW